MEALRKSNGKKHNRTFIPFVPWWVDICAAAESWGIPPWEIVPGHSKAYWLARRAAWARAQRLADQEKPPTPESEARKMA